MSEARATAAGSELLRLDDRVLETLEGSRGQVAFSGLRRVLHAHPESLSRALHRLEREGLVERVDGGYRSLAPTTSAPVGPPGARREIARVELPPGATAAGVASRLSGRWFGDLRWVGAFDQRRERRLVWARRDGTGTVVLGVADGSLRVYVHEGADGEDPAESEEAAYELLYHAAEAIRPAVEGRGGAVAFFAAPDPSLGPRALEN